MSKFKIPEEGLRFECKQSGKCCAAYGSEGYVILTESDLERMEKHLGKKKEEFAQIGEFQDTRGNRQMVVTRNWYLKDSEKQCQFLRGRQCGVYEARPTQCRTFPFWHENFGSKTWKKEITDMCKGVGQGRLYTKEEIEKIMQEQEQANAKTGVF